VIYQQGIGWWLGGRPLRWRDGVYVWVRANDRSGFSFEKAAKTANFAHRWVLRRFSPNCSVSVAPHPNEHFYFFRVNPKASRARIADLLALCARL
jgi:hypothetical protein